MILLKITAYAFIITYLLGLLIYVGRLYGINNWLLNSLDYPFRKYRINKLFNSLTEDDRLKYWLEYIETEEQLWFLQKIDKFVQEKYIKPILKEHGEI